MAASSGDATNSAFHSYYREIVRQMMFANGDLEDPIPTCIDMVLDMAKYQMVKALEDAWKKAQNEKRDCIMLEDVLVLFKHHKFILNRLLQFARTAESVNELKRAAPRTAKLDEEREEGSDQEDNAVPSTSVFDTSLSRMKAVVDSMNLGETADQLLEMRDVAYEERKKRIAHLGDDMTQDEFLRFTEARQATFRDDSKQKTKL
ncbi:unnamed protein product [Cylicostephanus goldi]|uniref:Uncharacterized protein n=1 Tax=Cylicostephanus goldi TaxID=71465 RepID=A0A3P7MX99_CYLGO|nr:unnamed protein product [Cylicostephanus goldi]